GASFARVGVALACALDGATILAAPGVYEGPATLDKAVTLCAAVAGACASGAPDVVLRGGGATVVRLAAPGAILRGFVVENPGFAATGDVSPALVSVESPGTMLRGVTLREAASALRVGEWRRATTAVAVLSDGGRLEDVEILSMPSSLAPGASCGAGDCRTYGVRSDQGAADLLVNASAIRLGGAHPAVGVLSSGPATRIELTTIEIPGDALGDGRADVGVLAQGRDLPRWEVRDSAFRTAGGEPRTGTGLDGALLEPVVERSAFRDLATGLRLDAPAASVSSSEFRGLGRALLLDAGAHGLTLRGSAFDADGTTIALSARTVQMDVDARGNDWGVYARDAIRARFQDLGSGNEIDESCFLDADRVAPVCPPEAAIGLPSTAPWGRELRFRDLSVPHGRAIASWTWDFGDGGTSTLQGPLHAYARSGTYEVRLTVADAEGYASTATATLDVTNAAPLLDALPDRRVAENQLLRVVAGGSDPDGDALAWSASGLPPGATFDAATRTLSWRPTYAQEGTVADVTIAATDGDLAASRTFRIDVDHANAPPALRVEGPTTGRENSLLTFTLVADDMDADAITFDPPYPFVRNLTLDDHGDGTATVSWTPDFQQAGKYKVRFGATDGEATVEIAVDVTIANHNRPPRILPIPVQHVAETGTLQFFIQGEDDDHDAVSYRLMKAPAGATFDASKRLATWTPGYDHAGTHAMRFAVIDSLGAWSLADATVIVSNLDRAPTLAPVAPQTVKANRTLDLALPGSDPDAGDRLAYSSGDLPPGAAIVGSRLVWRPTPAQVGAHVVHVAVSDGNLTDEGEVVLEVVPNLAPEIALDAPARVEMGAPYSPSAAGTADPDGAAPVSYAWDFNASDGFQAQATGERPTVSFTRPGRFVATLVATDADGMASVRSFEVAVDDRVVVHATLSETAYAPDARYLATARVVGWDGAPIAGASVTFDVDYAPAEGAPATRLHRLGPYATDADGRVSALLPKDAAIANVPGRHVLTVGARVATSYLDDAETDDATLVYGDPLP
ncbi:MAG TPA: putative Ig domain-containing protein, partial [Candidatus Thermoplasmatota archaeon]|nr:putative Ig domain-containing protein [Candidatus Thermoplasmatota archaeon]